MLWVPIAMVTAVGFAASGSYAKALELRKNVSVADLKIVEGYDGPQPADS